MDHTEYANSTHISAFQIDLKYQCMIILVRLVDATPDLVSKALQES